MFSLKSPHSLSQTKTSDHAGNALKSDSLCIQSADAIHKRTHSALNGGCTPCILNGKHFHKPVPAYICRVACFSMHSLGSRAHDLLASFGLWRFWENLSQQTSASIFFNPPLANNIYNSAHKLTPLPDRSTLPFIEMNIFPRANLAECTFKQLKHLSWNRCTARALLVVRRRWAVSG